MKNKKYIDNKNDWLVQLESHIQNGVRNQLISFNKDQTQITYHVREPHQFQESRRVRSSRLFLPMSNQI